MRKTIGTKLPIITTATIAATRLISVEMPVAS
jgi:hypothetical protein